MRAPTSVAVSPHTSSSFDAPTTPISATQHATQWLAHIVAALPDAGELPRTLDELLDECLPASPSSGVTTGTALLDGAEAAYSATDAKRDVHTRLRTMLDSTTALAGARRSAAGKLYCRLLEALVRSERVRLSPALQTSTLAALLAHDRFHRAVFACAVEMVAAVHGVQLEHAQLLSALALEPFELFKVLESALRHERNAPRSLTRQLVRVQELIVEQLVWASDASSWTQLAAAPLSRDTVQQLCALPSTLAGAAGASAAAAAAAVLGTTTADSRSSSTINSTDAVAAAQPAQQALIVSCALLAAFSRTRTDTASESAAVGGDALVHALQTVESAC
jgi:hypothetical protein